VIKQKDPVALIQFGGPETGADAPAWLAVRDAFPWPGNAELKPRRTWLLDEAAQTQLESISDAAVLEDHLYVLSANSRCIARLQAPSADRPTVKLEGGPWACPTRSSSRKGWSSSRRAVSR
jgi:hypothetical protein